MSSAILASSASTRLASGATRQGTLAEVGDKPFAVPADKERYLDALRRAGLPEG